MLPVAYTQRDMLLLGWSVGALRGLGACSLHISTAPAVAPAKIERIALGYCNLQSLHVPASGMRPITFFFSDVAAILAS